tara:strand:+ start:305 stop:529 length:225 start_codon:yes stop_codon:yes gene_type:complete
MGWILVHIEESGGSVAAVDLSSVSMIGKSEDGSSTIFFNNPDNRVRVVDKFEDLISQISEADSGLLERLSKSEN